MSKHEHKANLESQELSQDELQALFASIGIDLQRDDLQDEDRADMRAQQEACEEMLKALGALGSF